MSGNQNYDFNLSVGITELLDADAAAKVESQIEKQKQKLEQPVEIKVELNVQDAKARIKELQANMTSVARAMQKITNKKGTLGKADYDNIAKYHGTLQRDQREIDNITKQLKAQGVAVRNNTKEYKALQAVLEEIGYVEKQKKTSTPRKNATAEVKKQTAAEKEHIKSIEDSINVAEAQSKAAQQIKHAHDDAASAAKERADAEQQVSDVGKTQGKIIDTVTAKTQKQTDAIKKQEKATRDLANAQQTVNVKKKSAKTMADFQKLWGKAAKNYSAEDFGKRYGHLMESISGDNPTMTIDAAYKELQKKDREYRKQLEAENAKRSAIGLETQTFLAAMQPLNAQINASETVAQEYARALEEITAGSLTAAAATERLQAALRDVSQEAPTETIKKNIKTKSKLQSLSDGDKNILTWLFKDKDTANRRGKEFDPIEELSLRVSTGGFKRLRPRVKEIMNNTVAQLGLEDFGDVVQHYLNEEVLANSETLLFTLFEDYFKQNIRQISLDKWIEKIGGYQSDRNNAVKMLNGLSVNYPDFINFADTYGLGSINLRIPDNTTQVEVDTKAVEENTQAVKENVDVKKQAWDFSATPSGQLTMFEGMADPIDKAAGSAEDLKDTLKDIGQIAGQISFDDLLKTVYHAGDLSNITKTLKSFPLGNVPPRKGDGIGGLTGLYTTDDVSGFWGTEWHGAPISTIDLSKYKLLSANTNDVADKIGAFLGDLNATIYGYYEAIDEKDWTYTKRTDVKTINELYVAHQELFNESNLTIEQLTKFIKDAQSKIVGKSFADIKLPAIDEGVAKSGISSALQDVSDELFNSDSFKTQFLRMLGYEGVDLRGTKYNSTYSGGTVLFDVKQDSLQAVNEKWSDFMPRFGYEISEDDLKYEEKRRQLAFDTAKAYSKTADDSKTAADQAERQAQAEAEAAKSAHEVAKAKLTAIQRQAYNYRRPAKNDAALTERESILTSQLSEINAVRAEFPVLESACASAENAVSKTLDGIRSKIRDVGTQQDAIPQLTEGMKAVEASAESAAAAQDKLVQANRAFVSATDSTEQQINEQALREFRGVIASDMVELQGIRINGTPEEQDADDKADRDAVNKAFKDHAALSEALKAKYGNTEFDKNIVGVLSNFIQNTDTQRKLGGTSGVRRIANFADGKSDITELANGYYRLVQWINSNGVSMTEGAVTSLDSLFKYLLGQGIEIIDRTGATIGTVLNSALPQVDNIISGLPEASRSDDDVITKTIRPVIMQGNKILQRGVFEVNQASESVAESQNKLVQANNELAASTEKVEQQINEQTAAIKQQDSVLPKLTGTEHKAAFGGGELDDFLRSYNITGKDANEIADMATEAMRVNKQILQYVDSNGDDPDMVPNLVNRFNQIVGDIADAVMKKGKIKLPLAADVESIEQFLSLMSGAKIRYDEDDRAEFGDDWKNIRARFMKTLTTSPSARTADSYYHEILESIPGILDGDHIAKQNQLRELLNKLDWARKLKKNDFTQWSAIPDVNDDFIRSSIDGLLLDMGDKLSKAIPQLDEQIQKEKELGSAITVNNAAREEGVRTIKAAADAEELSDDIDGDNVKESIIRVGNESARMISLISSAAGKDAATKFLEGITSESDLQGRISSYFNTVFNTDDWKFKSGQNAMSVVGDTYTANLVNGAGDALKAVFKLKDGVLELQQDVTKLSIANAVDTFDADGMQKRALASVEKLRSGLHGLQYDLSELESMATKITSQQDYQRFTNQFKAAQDSIQAMKNATVSKSSMNQLANMQRDMKNANTELDTMRLKLQKIGDIDGVAKASGMIDDMVKAVKEFNDASDAKGQQDAYGKYSGLRSEFDAQLRYLNAAKSLGIASGVDTDSSETQITDKLIKGYYQTLNNTIKQINSINSKIYSAKLGEDGAGVWAPWVDSLEAQRTELLGKLESTANEINTIFRGTFVAGDQFELPFSHLLNSLQDSNTRGIIQSFFGDVRTQSALTEQNIATFTANLNKAQIKTEEFAIAITEKINSVSKSMQTLASLGMSGTVDVGSSWYQDGANMIANLNAYMANLPADRTMWSSEQTSYVMAQIEQINNYVAALDKAANKEAQYFADKKKITNVESLEDYDQQISKLKQSEEYYEARQKLEEHIRSKFGADDTVIGGFTQSADGISKLDFSAFDTITGKYRNFSAELGKFSDEIRVHETSMQNLTFGTDAANKALKGLTDASNILGDLSSNVKAAELYADVLTRIEELKASISQKRDSTSADDQNDLMKRAKEAEELIQTAKKLQIELNKIQDGVGSGTLESLGQIDSNKDVFAQMYAAIKQAAGDATISNVKFDQSTNTLAYTLTDANKTVTQMTANLHKLSGVVTQQSGKVGTLKSAWGDIKGSIGGIFKETGRYAINLLQVTDMIRYMRQGFNEVKEIDSALTELKKVTNETDTAYSNFLQNMSKSGARIGSTVKDLTTSAADWARLGYSMEQAGQLAENTMILMNVSEFDNVSEATDTLISAMQAFKTDGMDAGAFSMEIIDIFNKIGKIIA